MCVRVCVGYRGLRLILSHCLLNKCSCGNLLFLFLPKRAEVGSSCQNPYVAVGHHCLLHTELILLQGLPLSLADIM